MNVLIIKLGALGDVVMATALVDAIRQHHRDAHHCVLTTPPYAALFQAWPDLDVMTHARGGWRQLWASARWIRSMKFDRIYDLQGNDRSAVMCALSGSPVRVGNHTRYPYSHHPETPWTGQSHVFKRMCEVLAAAGIEHVTHAPSLPVSATERDAVVHWIAEHELGERRFVLLHAAASAGRPEKIWPHFAAFAERLLDHSVTPVWIGAGADAAINARLCASVGGIDASDAFSLPALAELGRHARFAVANDSGPMHVLAAAEIPVFGLFGPSDWRRNHAIGQADHVIACVECCDGFRGQRAAACLDRITVDMVWARLVAAGLA